jgi:hypothetical protein
MTIIRGFTGARITIKQEYFHDAIVFVFLFNFLFFFSEYFFWKLFPKPKVSFDWVLAKDDVKIKRLLFILYMFWFVGGVWYYFQTSAQGYRDYVEGSSWAVVFFWASSPLITILTMQKRRVAAFISCIPFLYFAVHLQVRSFALLSLVPFLIVQFYQLLSDPQQKTKFRKIIKLGIVSMFVLVFVSIFVSKYKTGEFGFPDSGMPFGVVQVIALAQLFNKYVGFDGLTLYGWNYINPFMRLFSITKPDIDDTPVIIARLMQGVPENWGVYFHYPALIWSDSFLSFGWNGIYLAIFWALILCIWDAIMMNFPMLLALLLPSFAWHNYMLVRGAIAIASVPISYSLYFSFFAFLLTLGSRIFLSINRSRYIPK